MKNELTDSGKFLTFVHKFSRTVQCEVRVPDNPPETGALNVLPYQWTGKLKPKHIGEYRRWVLSMNQTLTDHWQTRILYALGTHKNRTELWGFTPGEAPKLLERMNTGML